MPPTPVLEPFTKRFLDNFNLDIVEVGYEFCRNLESQMAVQVPDVLEEEKLVPSRDGIKSINLVITRPVGSENKILPVILFLHGGGFVVGNRTSYRATRTELTVRANAAVVFVEYSLSPEVRHPVALEECYDALEWLSKNSASINVDPNSIVVAGDSAGGNLATVLAILDKKRNLNAIKFQVLYYPLTDYKQNSESSKQFHDGYYVTAKNMKYIWEHYIPHETDRADITASPLYATSEDLKGVAPVFLVTAEADMLRDEGEAYGRNLLQAGVSVYSIRVLGLIHGVLNIGELSPLAINILDQTADVLRRVWGKKYTHL